MHSSKWFLWIPSIFLYLTGALAQAPSPEAVIVSSTVSNTESGTVSGGRSQPSLEAAYRLLAESKVEEAIAALEEAMVLEPTNMTIRMELGYAYERIGKLSEATAEFESVVRHQPENARARLGLGYLYHRQGRPRDAEREFRAAKKIGKEDHRTQATQALATIEAERQEAKTEGSDKIPSETDVLLNRGYDFLNQGQVDRAIASFRQASELEPQNVTIFRELGFAHLRKNDSRGALTAFEQARQLEPNDRRTALQLGYLHTKLDDPRKAELQFQRASTADDEPTRNAARQGLTTLKPMLHRSYLSFYGVMEGFGRDKEVRPPRLLQRPNMGLGFFRMRYGYRPRLGTPLSIYLNTRVTREFNTTEGTLVGTQSSIPVVTADNAALFGGGIAYKLPKLPLSIRGESNIAVNLNRHPGNNAKARGDHRVLLTLYRASQGSWFSLARGNRLFSELDLSAGYYSRYHNNVIGYGQARFGAEAPLTDSTALRGYLRVGAAKDSGRDYYNNFAEFGPGVELIPSRRLGISLRTEYTWGFYLGPERLIERTAPGGSTFIDGRNPFAAQYREFRVYLIFNRLLRF